MAEMKYVKFADGAVIEATQVSESMQQDSSERRLEVLLLQIDTDSAENKVDTYSQQITTAGLADVNVFSDADCKNQIFKGGVYKSVMSITATIRANGLLYSISLSK
ncbi:hypothetical protein [Caproicibacterium sp. XB1]|uniref:hypothetical protein n=1 Tax=Caproicibacterium sp. XB1 TaxID=3396405 RepID=UPI0039B6FADA